MLTSRAPSEFTTRPDAVRTPTIVVGAGPAGLAVGACLKQANLPCLILEQSDKVGSAWRQHYNRLHLHTAKAYSALPFVPFPKDYPRYPSRLQMISKNGTPLSSGQATPIPGLYFCGYHVSPTGMLREIAFEAQRISAAIARRII